VVPKDATIFTLLPNLATCQNPKIKMQHAMTENNAAILKLLLYAGVLIGV